MGERGVTLVELMVAMLLLAVALIGLAASFPFSMYAVTDGGRQTVATNLALEIIEQAKRTSYAALPDLAAARGTVAGFDGFEREVVVEAYNPGANPCADCTSVTVRVFFTGQQGEVVTTISTIFSGS